MVVFACTVFGELIGCDFLASLYRTFDRHFDTAIPPSPQNMDGAHAWAMSISSEASLQLTSDGVPTWNGCQSLGTSKQYVSRELGSMFQVAIIWVTAIDPTHQP
jgi:hypothetical protein